METKFILVCVDSKFLFLPYLWGMETIFWLNGGGWDESSYRTYEEWKHVDLSPVVQAVNGSYRTYEEWKLSLSSVSVLTCLMVLTVPMRNGNDGVIYGVTVVEGSYRTYEEWKQCNNCVNKCHKFSSYRTYEEWKLTFHFFFDNIFLCSYRTYEEWKLIYWPKKHGRCRRVLTVPMRNGNLAAYRRAITQGDSSYRTYEEWKLNNLSS